MIFFFFKQKTAYELRISDWSSDVCSSDLPRRGPAAEADGHGFFARSPGADRSDSQRFAIFIGQAKPNAVALGPDANRETHRRILDRDFLLLVRRLPHAGGPGGRPFTSSEKRRVGKECFSTCRSRWS